MPKLVGMNHIALEVDDVDEALGLPSGTVKSRTARALERLRESYD